MRDAQSSLGKGSDVMVMRDVEKKLFISAQIWVNFGSKKIY
jgi:copper(I)-binding protein